MLSSVRSKGGACTFMNMCGNLSVCSYDLKKKDVSVCALGDFLCIIIPSFNKYH